MNFDDVQDLKCKVVLTDGRVCGVEWATHKRGEYPHLFNPSPGATTAAESTQKDGDFLSDLGIGDEKKCGVPITPETLDPARCGMTLPCPLHGRLP